MLYNGSSSQRKEYKTVSLNGVIPNQGSGFGTLSFAISGIQNGGPDGLALVDREGNVLQFLSYEGSFEAVDGPAEGMTSTDIGVAETSSTAVGESLQLTGSGFRYEDFVWQASAVDNFGLVNAGQTFVAPAPFINEIHYDNTGGDSDEGVEIAGLAGTDLSGMSIVLYNGSSSQRKVYRTESLSDVIPNQDSGFGTLSFAISGIQNGGPDGLALVDSEGVVLQFLSYEGSFEAVDGPAVGMTSTDIGVSEAGNSPVGHSLQLAGTGVQYADFEWQGSAVSTFSQVNTEQRFGSGSGSTDGGTGGTDGGTADLGQCADTATLISAVQGSGFVSPLMGQTHVVEAVVSASLPNLKGFFIQEEPADMDADPATSEGLFVFYEGELPSEGDVVRVLGEVTEYFEKTQIIAQQVSTACTTATLVATEFSLPFANAAEAEALEGMLVTASQELTVSENYDLKVFGEVTLSYGRLYTPTNQFTPGSAEAIALAAENALNKVILDDGVNGSNPEVIPYPAGGLSALNSLRTGDTVTGLIGPMDYSFDAYRVIPLVTPTIFASNPRQAAPEIAEGNLKVASLNVLNYFSTLDENGNKCGPSNLDCRGANNAEEFARQKAKTVAAIVAMDADIVGLMEIENSGFSAGSAIDDLVSEINSQMGVGTYSIVDAGGPVGTDAITVALIYKSANVSPVGALGILDSSNSITDADGPLFVDTKNRPALVQTFALTENAEELVVSVNHFKSKGSGCGAGDDDSTTGQGNCNLTRTRAAQALTAFIASEYGDKPTVILGDLNAYAKEDPIAKIEAAGYTNLVNYFAGSEAYSYTFGGEFGYLDHALANSKALAKTVDVTEWHINADEPRALDYNMEDKSAQQLVDLYEADAYRMSDHDPVVIAMQFDAPASAETSADVNQDGVVNFSDYFAILGMLGSTEGSANFNAIADYDGDNLISPLDLQAWYQMYLSQ
ncbi:ExeM/NucH family extracellular endonuclease [Paraglaciecola aquimarina]|uniref:ExeM/NucH family extracellular endonuclease n=1 Tax=Paraglaciecola aquimarina TaxID=1235557 RepID=A0ABU3SW82_9ALTE|nr:ExeM/NucH family extracellular endonuclease [Paraglaciecola aquimarina]MDU0354242.1 ExeM/NucH family extracellular endonuclease [Paraglaciecola aquimarina]